MEEDLMRGSAFLCLLAAVVLMSAAQTRAQGASDACGDSAGSSWATDPVVFGRVNLQGFEGAKFPKITVTLFDRNRNEHRFTIDRNGYYCFRSVEGGGGTIVIDVEGNEVERRSLGSSTSSLRQHRQDFDIFAAGPVQKLGTISAKFVYQRDAANTTLFDKAVDAEQKKDLKGAATLLREILGNDPRDYVAWARL
jgi:hypothetical protein